MNSLIQRYVCSPFQKGLDVCQVIVKEPDALEKTAKIVARGIDIAATFHRVSQPLLSVASQLRDTVTVLEGIKIFGVMHLLLCKDKKTGQYFLLNKDNSWQKCADRLLLAAHCYFKTVKVLMKVNLVKSGLLAKHVIGKLPAFTLVMDGFMIGSSFFSAWDTIGNGLPKVNKELSSTNNKVEKWKERLNLFVDNLDENQKSKLEMLFDKYQSKGERISNELIEQKRQLLEAQKALLEDEGKIEKCQARISQLEPIQKKNNERLEKIQKQDYQGLSEELAKLESPYISYKIEKWETKQENAQIAQNKNWIRVANSILKIAVIALAFTLVGLNAWSLPCVLSLFALGMVVDSIGLTKVLYEDLAKPKPLPVFTI